MSEQRENLLEIIEWAKQYDVPSRVIPRDPDKLFNIAELNISWGYFAELPKNIHYLENLQYIHLEYCSEIKTLPENLALLPKLRVLDVYHCDKFRNLPNNIVEISTLEKLRIRYSPIVILPKNISKLKNLQVLTLWGCEKLTYIPPELGQLENLCELYFDDCTKLNKLPSELGQLKQLKILGIGHCKQLKSIPDELSSLGNLEILYIYGCHKLNNIPEAINDNKNLLLIDNKEEAKLREIINWAYDNNIEKRHLMPYNTAVLYMRELNLSDYTHITELPANLDFLPNLEVLNLTGCNNIKIPEYLEHNQRIKLIV